MIGSPLPADFLSLCASLGIPVSHENRLGHIAIDGQPVDLSLHDKEVFEGWSKPGDRDSLANGIHEFPLPRLSGAFFVTPFIRGRTPPSGL